MQKRKVAIVHFLPLEQYPPAMNMIDFLIAQEQFAITCITTRKLSTSWFQRSEVKIVSYGKQSANALMRYLSFLRFNIGSLFHLLSVRPDRILYYETYSSFPVFLYLKLFPKTKVLVHYHEYLSPEEIAAGSPYFKFLLRKEAAVLQSAIWISHTNEDRLRFFLQDKRVEKKPIHQTLSNYPSANWKQSAGETFFQPSSVTRVVYVGALSLDTMYFKEFAYWVEGQKGRVVWDVYTSQNVASVSQFLKTIGSNFIHLREEVNYFDLPKVLVHYQCGVILYKAHIKNFQYNAPNKLFEYLACGLTVVYPKEMLGCQPYLRQLGKTRLIQTDFKNMNDFQLKIDFSNTDTYRERSVDFFYEKEYEKILKHL